jgi:hypothetical protein
MRRGSCRFLLGPLYLLLAPHYVHSAGAFIVSDMPVELEAGHMPPSDHFQHPSHPFREACPLIKLSQRNQIPMCQYSCLHYCNPKGSEAENIVILYTNAEPFSFKEYW